MPQPLLQISSRVGGKALLHSGTVEMSPVRQNGTVHPWADKVACLSGGEYRSIVVQRCMENAMEFSVCVLDTDSGPVALLPTEVWHFPNAALVARPRPKAREGADRQAGFDQPLALLCNRRRRWS